MLLIYCVKYGMIILDICAVRSKNRMDLIPFGLIGAETDEEGRALSSSNDWIHDLQADLPLIRKIQRYAI